MACGTAVLTTHRLAYVDDVRPQRHSCAVALECIKQSEHYAGFLKSSPKIALLLASAPAVEETWTCGVCGYRSSGETCGMCGVRRSVAGSVPAGAPPPHLDEASQWLPRSSCGVWPLPNFGRKARMTNS